MYSIWAQEFSQMAKIKHINFDKMHKLTAHRVP